MSDIMEHMNTMDSMIFSNYFYTNYGNIQNIPDWPYRTDKGPNDFPRNMGPSDDKDDFLFDTLTATPNTSWNAVKIPHPYNLVSKDKLYEYIENEHQVSDYETYLGCLKPEWRDRYFLFLTIEGGRRKFRYTPYMEYVYSLFRHENMTLKNGVIGFNYCKLRCEVEKDSNKLIYVVNSYNDLLDCSFTIIRDVNGRDFTYQRHYIGVAEGAVTDNRNNNSGTIMWSSESVLEHEFREQNRNNVFRIFHTEDDCMNFLREHSFQYWDLFGFRVKAYRKIG